MIFSFCSDQSILSNPFIDAICISSLRKKKNKDKIKVEYVRDPLPLTMIKEIRTYYSNKHKIKYDYTPVNGEDENYNFLTAKDLERMGLTRKEVLPIQTDLLYSELRKLHQKDEGRNYYAYFGLELCVDVEIPLSQSKIFEDSIPTKLKNLGWSISEAFKFGFDPTKFSYRHECFGFELKIYRKNILNNYGVYRFEVILSSNSRKLRKYFGLGNTIKYQQDPKAFATLLQKVWEGNFVDLARFIFSDNHFDEHWDPTVAGLFLEHKLSKRSDYSRDKIHTFTSGLGKMPIFTKNYFLAATGVSYNLWRGLTRTPPGFPNRRAIVSLGRLLGKNEMYSINPIFADKIKFLKALEMRLHKYCGNDPEISSLLIKAVDLGNDGMLDASIISVEDLKQRVKAKNFRRLFTLNYDDAFFNLKAVFIHFALKAEEKSEHRAITPQSPMQRLDILGLGGNMGVLYCANQDLQYDFIIETIVDLEGGNPGASICVVGKTQASSIKIKASLNMASTHCGIDLFDAFPGFSVLSADDIVGKEFDYVFMPDADVETYSANDMSLVEGIVQASQTYLFALCASFVGKWSKNVERELTPCLDMETMEAQYFGVTRGFKMPETPAGGESYYAHAIEDRKVVVTLKSTPNRHKITKDSNGKIRDEFQIGVAKNKKLNRSLRLYF